MNTQSKRPTSYFVRRDRDGRESWTGPLRSERQADREAQAWRDAGWYATVEPATPEIKAEVRAWEKTKRAA